MVKQVIVVRSDIKMSKGKLAAQVAHASLSSSKNTKKNILKTWEEEGQKKVILKADDLSQLMKIKEKCRKLKINCFLITDAGSTELRPGTVTCLGIGPEEDSKINKVTGSLPLLK